MSHRADAPAGKFVVVLNRKIDPGAAMNAAAHMVAALIDRADADDRARMRFLEYTDADGGVHPVSGLSLIVLRADNSNKIRGARQRAIDEDILCVDFTESMTGGASAEQMQRTGSLPESELDYYGLCMFGEQEKIDGITAKFSLWR